MANQNQKKDLQSTLGYTYGLILDVSKSELVEFMTHSALLTASYFPKKWQPIYLPSLD